MTPPDTATQIHGVLRLMLKAKAMRMIPDAISDAPRMSVSAAAARSGFQLRLVSL